MHSENNVMHSVKVLTEVSEVGAGSADRCEHVPKVHTRYFYNSKFRTKSVLGLFARDNKKKHLVGGSDHQLDVNSKKGTRNLTPDGGMVGANNVSNVSSKSVHVADNYVRTDIQSGTASHLINGIEQNVRGGGGRKRVAPVGIDQCVHKPIDNVKGLVRCEEVQKVDTLTNNNGCVPIYGISVSCYDEKFVNSLLNNQKKGYIV